MSAKRRRAACIAQGRRTTVRAVLTPSPPEPPRPPAPARPVLTRVDDRAVERLAERFRRPPARMRP